MIQIYAVLSGFFSAGMSMFPRQQYTAESDIGHTCVNWNELPNELST
jgi:hypothetical protein